MSNLVFVKYINKLIIYPYKVASATFDDVSPSNFRFVIIGVVIGVDNERGGESV